MNAAMQIMMFLEVWLQGCEDMTLCKKHAVHAFSYISAMQRREQQNL